MPRAVASGNKRRYYCVQYLGRFRGGTYRRSVTILQNQPPTNWRAFTAARDDFQQFAFGQGAIDLVQVESILSGACGATTDTDFVCGSVPSTPAGLVWANNIGPGSVFTFSAAGASGTFDMNNAPGGGNSAFDATTQICNPTSSIRTLRFTFNVEWDASLSNVIQIIRETPTPPSIVFSRSGSFAGGSDVIVHDIPLPAFGPTSILFEFNQTATSAEMHGTFTCSLV